MAFSLSTVTNILNTGRAFLLGNETNSASESDYDFMLDTDIELRGEFQSPREEKGFCQSPRSSHELRASCHELRGDELRGDELRGVELRGDFQSPRFIKPPPKFIPIVSEMNQNEKPNIIRPKVINRPSTITTKLYKTNETILSEEYDDNSFNN
jgi:hypothetical protein